MEMRDLHTHTVYSDGKNTPEEMIEAAIARGMTTIGISDHSYTDFDESYCMKKADREKYRTHLAALKERYAGRIEVLCGIEQDLGSGKPDGDYDYVIGSVHYVFAGGRCITVDETPETLTKAAAECFGGDIYALCEAYYENVARVVEETGADIVGHFDLITKFNEGERLFSESEPRYVAAWQKAADALLRTGAVFEINTGAISRGYRTAPYPAKPIRDYIAARGGRFMYSSDSHKTETLCFGFEDGE